MDERDPKYDPKRTMQLDVVDVSLVAEAVPEEQSGAPSKGPPPLPTSAPAPPIAAASAPPARVAPPSAAPQSNGRRAVYVAIFSVMLAGAAVGGWRVALLLRGPAAVAAAPSVTPPAPAPSAPASAAPPTAQTTAAPINLPAIEIH